MGIVFHSGDSQWLVGQPHGKIGMAGPFPPITDHHIGNKLAMPQSDH